ncbi:hypothetical protein B1810_09090 [Panacagrimonas perspica]|nr:hypothetical protein [Panacagrimonas perspica]THD03688.1 hypothetical protein B1810_09090 [Panacagrimonas perspica]
MFLAGLLLLGQVMADAWAVDPGCCHDGKPCPMMMTSASSASSCTSCVSPGLQPSWPVWWDRSMEIERVAVVRIDAVPGHRVEIWRPPAV